MHVVCQSRRRLFGRFAHHWVDAGDRIVGPSNDEKSFIVLLGFLFVPASLLELGCSDEPTNGTGGSAGSSSSSGEAGASGGMMSAAEKYCTDIMANCTAGEAQYADMKSCVNSAMTFPPGTAADTKGDTLGCRAYHATAAKDAPAMHCVHAGPAGGGSVLPVMRDTPRNEGRSCSRFTYHAEILCTIGL